MSEIEKLSYEELKSQRPSVEEHQNQDRFPIYCVLDNIRSIFNVGAVFRTSDATRIKELVLCGMTASPPRKEIDKTALGSVETVPWKYFKSSEEAISYLKEQGCQIIAVEHTNKSVDYREFKPKYPIALIFGHEVAGIKDETMKLVDEAVEIPMYGVKQSLNIAVSYGVCTYHFVHKYLDSV